MPIIAPIFDVNKLIDVNGRVRDTDYNEIEDSTLIIAGSDYFDIKDGIHPDEACSNDREGENKPLYLYRLGDKIYFRKNVDDEYQCIVQEGAQLLSKNDNDVFFSIINNEAYLFNYIDGRFDKIEVCDEFPSIDEIRLIRGWEFITYSGKVFGIFGHFNYKLIDFEYPCKVLDIIRFEKRFDDGKNRDIRMKLILDVELNLWVYDEIDWKNNRWIKLDSDILQILNVTGFIQVKNKDQYYQNIYVTSGNHNYEIFICNQYEQELYDSMYSFQDRLEDIPYRYMMSVNSAPFRFPLWSNDKSKKSIKNARSRID
jgi:hypothetical protein